MADEEEIELTEEQQAELNLQKELAERMPALVSVEDYEQLIDQDEEHLVMVTVIAAEHCPYSKGLRPTLSDLSAPRSVTKHAKFYRVEVDNASTELLQKLGIFQVPATALFLKGQERARMVGDGAEKLGGLFRNELIKRNEEMKEFDEAKLAAMRPPPEDEEREEGDEEEEEDD